VLIGEDLLLMSLEVSTGRPIGRLGAIQRPRFLSACLLAELAVQKQIGWTPDGVSIFDDLPSFHALIGEALGVVRHGNIANPAAGIRAVSREIRDLRDRHLTSLVDRGLLHEGGRKRYFIVGPRCYPVRSTRARNEAIEHLREAAVGTSNSMRSLAMLLLADSVAATLHLLSESEANEASSRASALIRDVKEELPQTLDWSPTHSAISMLVGIVEALPHVL
jgi:hypothetical protein